MKVLKLVLDELDHSQIAFNKPKKLYGIDITKRAVEHTKKRFKSLNLKVILLLEMQNHYHSKIIFLTLYTVGVFITLKYKVCK